MALYVLFPRNRNQLPWTSQRYRSSSKLRNDGRQLSLNLNQKNCPCLGCSTTTGSGFDWTNSLKKDMPHQASAHVFPKIPGSTAARLAAAAGKATTMVDPAINKNQRLDQGHKECCEARSAAVSDAALLALPQNASTTASIKDQASFFRATIAWALLLLT